MSTKTKYFITFTIILSTMGIYMPLLVSGFEWYGFFLSITMYAIPMVVGSNTEPLIFNDITKSEKVNTQFIIFIVTILCIVDVCLIKSKSFIWCLILSAVILAITLINNWKQLDSKDFTDTTSSLGGDINK